MSDENARATVDETGRAVVAALEDVFFSYDRDLELPAEGLGPEPEPDARGGLVLRSLDLELAAGSFTVVMGASGGGKSTLLRTLNAIIPAFIKGQFSGRVEVLGRDTTEARVSEMADAVGMVLQDYEAQLFGTSVEAEVAFGPENLAVPVGTISDRIEAALATVGLDDLNRRREPADLSGGQKQRLVLAGVLAMQPEVLVLDEPTSDLDPKGAREIIEVIGQLSGQAESTDGSDEWAGPASIAMVTHDVEEALLADQAVLLKGGRVFRTGSVREVFRDIEALESCRIAVPPLVAAFDRLGIDRASLPLLPAEAIEVVRARGLDWTPPARRGEPLPGVPAGTGETTGDTIFAIRDLTHAYSTNQGSVKAIEEIELTITAGEVVAIVGQNGSGKTTLAKHLNGLLSPDTGSVRWRGTDVASLSMNEIGRDVGFLFQNPDHQLFARTVREEVRFGPENFGLTGDELETRVTEAIASVELEPLEEADPFNLSKGQRQRVALASVLATDPDVIIFDEPTTGLDAPQQTRFMDMVARLNRETGTTIIMVTHDMPTVARYAPRTVVLQDGRVQADAPTRELFAEEVRLRDWELAPPHVVAFSNELGDATALPALGVDEVVAGLKEDS